MSIQIHNVKENILKLQIKDTILKSEWCDMVIIEVLKMDQKQFLLPFTYSNLPAHLCVTLIKMAHISK